MQEIETLLPVRARDIMPILRKVSKSTRVLYAFLVLTLAGDARSICGGESDVIDAFLEKLKWSEDARRLTLRQWEELRMIETVLRPEARQFDPVFNFKDEIFEKTRSLVDLFREKKDVQPLKALLTFVLKQNFALLNVGAESVSSRLSQSENQLSLVPLASVMACEVLSLEHGNSLSRLRQLTPSQAKTGMRVPPIDTAGIQYAIGRYLTEYETACIRFGLQTTRIIFDLLEEKPVLRKRFEEFLLQNSGVTLDLLNKSLWAASRICESMHFYDLRYIRCHPDEDFVHVQTRAPILETEQITDMAKRAAKGLMEFDCHYGEKIKISVSALACIAETLYKFTPEELDMISDGLFTRDVMMTGLFITFVFGCLVRANLCADPSTRAHRLEAAYINQEKKTRMERLENVLSAWNSQT